jgi:hypothetical protein
MKFHAVILCLSLIVSCAAGYAQDYIRVEVDGPVDFEDMDNPRFDANFADSHTSNGWAVEGFDRPGQWIEVRLEESKFPGGEPMWFTLTMHSAVRLDSIVTYYIDFKVEGISEVVASDTIITPPGLSPT